MQLNLKQAHAFILNIYMTKWNCLLQWHLQQATCKRVITLMINGMWCKLLSVRELLQTLPVLSVPVMNLKRYPANFRISLLHLFLQLIAEAIAYCSFLCRFSVRKLSPLQLWSQHVHLACCVCVQEAARSYSTTRHCLSSYKYFPEVPSSLSLSPSELRLSLSPQ